jgi:hypothetical protein
MQPNNRSRLDSAEQSPGLARTGYAIHIQRGLVELRLQSPPMQAVRRGSTRGVVEILKNGSSSGTERRLAAAVHFESASVLVPGGITKSDATIRVASGSDGWTFMLQDNTRSPWYGRNENSPFVSGTRPSYPVLPELGWPGVRARPLGIARSSSRSSDRLSPWPVRKRSRKLTW